MRTTNMSHGPQACETFAPSRADYVKSLAARLKNHLRCMLLPQMLGREGLQTFSPLEIYAPGEPSGTSPEKGGGGVLCFGIWRPGQRCRVSRY